MAVSNIDINGIELTGTIASVNGSTGDDTVTLLGAGGALAISSV